MEKRARAMKGSNLTREEVSGKRRYRYPVLQSPIVFSQIFGSDTNTPVDIGTNGFIDTVSISLKLNR